MPAEPIIKPMPRSRRRYVFYLLLSVFVISIPFLYLYATGYRFDFFGDRTIVSTGGIFIATSHPEVEIYIDDALVRETRRFRKAFYAQNIDPGTHRVHVQREGYHTWVKELPVYSYLVTEVQAFNLPLVPSARIISAWDTATGSVVLPKSVLLRASSTQSIMIASTTATSTYRSNTEFVSLQELFGIEKATSSTQKQPAGIVAPLREFINEVGSVATTASSTLPQATTTKEYAGVRLFERDDNVVASWVGSRESMPYYYCSEPFPRWEGTTTPETQPALLAQSLLEEGIPEDDESLRVLQVASSTVCEPEIIMDRKGQKVSYFDFFPGSTDVLILGLESGVYAVEVDDRSWQNMQPILEGRNLRVRVDGGRVLIYDGDAFYEMIFERSE